MSYNGSGVALINSTGQPVSANTLIEASVFNAFTADVATMLSTAICRDGQTTVTANLPMATYRHTGVGNASARTDYAAAGQVQDGKLNWADGGGTADAITATYSPDITTLVDGQLCCVRATAANATTTPTFAPNGLTARTIVRRGGGALVAGSIAGDGHELILRYDLANTRWEFINSQSVIGTDVQAYDADTTKNDVANTFTGANTFRNAAGVRSEQDATQDAIALVGRAGGTGSYEVTITPATLTADRAITVRDKTGTMALLEGTNTNDSAAAGEIGEYVESSTVGYSVSAGGTTVFTDVTSIPLTAGDWDVTGSLMMQNNGATISGVELAVICTASGNNSTGSEAFKSSIEFYNATATANSGVVFPVYRVSLSGNQTRYLKGYATYSAGTPKFGGRISARRVR